MSHYQYTKLIIGLDLKHKLEVPVKYSLACALDNSNEFKLISSKGNKIEQKYIDGKTRRTIKYEKLNTGYELEKNKFITLSKNDLNSLSGESRIEIKDVGKISIQPERVIKTFYIFPDKSERSFGVIHKSLKQLKFKLVGYWFTKRRDHLILITPELSYLKMYQLYYDHEMRFPEQTNIYHPAMEEMNLCKNIFKSFNKNINLNEYFNNYELRLKDLIDAKSNSVIEQLHNSIK